MKLKREHIEKEFSEGHPKQGGDGYWIWLKKGFRWDGDPCPVHQIHEDTKTKAHKEEVAVCECKDCIAV